MSVLEPESGIWYAVCWLIVITRLLSRRIHLGSWKRLQLDDYLIVLAMCTDTLTMSVMHVVSTTSSNLIEPGVDVATFSRSEIDHRVLGSKLVLVVEQMQCITVWLVKACLLLMYRRMTFLLPQHIIVLGVAAYVAAGFVVMEILYLGVWCRPFTEYWAVPPKTTQCSAATNHLITNAVLNISSDLMIIAIPLPLLFKVKLPRKNKAILLGVFMIGTFTIVAAVLNKYYSFTSPFGSEWTIWYLRESYTAILCANLPLIYPLLQRIFKLKNWSHNSYAGTRYGTYGTNTRNGLSAIKSGIPSRRLQSETNSQAGTMQRTESEERIYEINGPLKIYQQTEFTVQTCDATEVELGDLAAPKSQTSIDTKSSRSSSPDRH
ncbi:hypothetical protein K491DRAFT_614704 [Lophiostoma macrostomum CBS 122681]|uniref:Rhodopsin domain-containing protein n=1 Tax=Lophiostoma macrostomum CBS 122681 TaxID=1314788 RepID=A0A6A6SMG1_9PLEO|nr:hypothetical protein K491DRAFT_614704 [Lophiostoma macrostomum CBS 122681]